MKLLRSVALGAAIGMAMAGCIHGPASDSNVADSDIAPDAGDGVWCGEPGHQASDRTYVNIRYADDGMPQASPASCEVKQGTRITWRGPAGSATRFDLDFPSGPPGRVAEGGLSSTKGAESDRERVTIDATSAPGTYKYGISANGKHLDPDVVIKPR